MNTAVIIPALNAETVLPEQLAALQNQDHTEPFTVLVCDNGSTDRTRAVAEAAGVQVIDASDHPGTGGARNVGALLTSCEYLLFCDADDVVAPGWVRAMTAALKDQPVVFGRIDIEKLNSVKAQVARPVAPALQSGDNGLPYAGDGNMAIRRSVFLELGGFDEALSHLHDVDFCWRLLGAGYALAYEPEALNHIRLRDSMRGVFRQGFTYGRGWALCVAKHEATAQRLAGHFDDLLEEYGIGQRSRHLRVPLVSTLVVVAGGFRQSVTGGAGQAIWQLGWKLGYRRGQREVRQGQVAFGSTTMAALNSVTATPEPELEMAMAVEAIPSDLDGSVSEWRDGGVAQQQPLDAGGAEVDAGDGSGALPLKFDHAS